MNQVTCKFIGGRMDGKLMAIDENTLRLRFPVLDSLPLSVADYDGPLTPAPIRIEVYERTGPQEFTFSEECKS